MNKGFTLIETMIYIALLTIIMTGALISIYQIFQSVNSVNTKVSIQNEGNFVLKKINWTLSGVESIDIPSAGEFSDTLSVTKTGGAQITIRHNPANQSVEIQNGTENPFIPITSNNIQVTSLGFEATTSPVLGVTATTTLGNTVFQTLKYLRK